MIAEVITDVRFHVPGQPDVLVLVRESQTGLYFAVDESYIEQAVDVLISPYNNGPLRLDEDQDEEYCLHPEVLKASYSDKKQHPLFTKKEWRALVTQELTELGYWAWVSERAHARAQALTAQQ